MLPHPDFERALSSHIASAKAEMIQIFQEFIRAHNIYLSQTKNKSEQLQIQLNESSKALRASEKAVDDLREKVTELEALLLQLNTSHEQFDIYRTKIIEEAHQSALDSVRESLTRKWKEFFDEEERAKNEQYASMKKTLSEVHSEIDLAIHGAFSELNEKIKSVEEKNRESFLKKDEEREKMFEELKKKGSERENGLREAMAKVEREVLAKSKSEEACELMRKEAEEAGKDLFLKSAEIEEKLESNERALASFEEKTQESFGVFQKSLGLPSIDSFGFEIPEHLALKHEEINRNLEVLLDRVSSTNGSQEELEKQVEELKTKMEEFKKGKKEDWHEEFQRGTDKRINELETQLKLNNQALGSISQNIGANFDLMIVKTNEIETRMRNLMRNEPQNNGEVKGNQYFNEEIGAKREKEREENLFQMKMSQIGIGLESERRVSPNRGSPMLSTEPKERRVSPDRGGSQRNQCEIIIEPVHQKTHQFQRTYHKNPIFSQENPLNEDVPSNFSHLRPNKEAVSPFYFPKEHFRCERKDPLIEIEPFHTRKMHNDSLQPEDFEDVREDTERSILASSKRYEERVTGLEIERNELKKEEIGVNTNKIKREMFGRTLEQNGHNRGKEEHLNKERHLKEREKDSNMEEIALRIADDLFSI